MSSASAVGLVAAVVALVAGPVGRSPVRHPGAPRGRAASGGAADALTVRADGRSQFDGSTRRLVRREVSRSEDGGDRSAGLSVAGWRPRSIGVAVAAALVVVGMVVGSPLVAGPAAVTAALGGHAVEQAAVRSRRGRRRDEVTALVDGVSRSVRSGATLAGALSEAGRDGGIRDLADELAHVEVELGAGRPLAVVLDDWSSRRADADLRLLAGTVSVLAVAGGSVAPAVDATAATIRSRAAAEAEVRVQAAQARASVAVLVAAPAVFAVVLATADPRLATFLVHRPAGALCVSAGLALDGLGLWWMQRIIDGATR